MWVARLYASPTTRQKLVEKHQLVVEDIEDAVLCVSGLPYTWHEHPERGGRALIEVTIRSQRVLVVLYPAEDPLGDAWNLGSAYPL